MLFMVYKVMLTYILNIARTGSFLCHLIAYEIIFYDRENRYVKGCDAYSVSLTNNFAQFYVLLCVMVQIFLYFAIAVET